MLILIITPKSVKEMSAVSAHCPAGPPSGVIFCSRRLKKSEGLMWIMLFTRRQVVGR